jgi:hypothetical protein
MSRASVPSDHAERCLGHVIGGVRGTYDRHEYYREKQLAFEALASLVERIVDPKANVVPLRGVCRQNISDIRFGNLREYLAHLV